MAPKILHILSIIGLFYLIPAAPTWGEEKIILGKSGYPVPRYVTLAKDTVNVRTGPGRKYPITWVYKRKGLPLKIVNEYENWRKFIDSEGSSGWIWGPLLSSRRTGLITAKNQILLKQPKEDSDVALKAEAGVIGQIIECKAGWCRLNFNGIKGWLRQDQIWGVFAEETLK